MNQLHDTTSTTWQTYRLCTEHKTQNITTANSDDRLQPTKKMAKKHDGDQNFDGDKKLWCACWSRSMHRARWEKTQTHRGLQKCVWDALINLKLYTVLTTHMHRDFESGSFTNWSWNCQLSIDDWQIRNVNRNRQTKPRHLLVNNIFNLSLPDFLS